MNQKTLSRFQHIYIPAVAIDCATLKHSWNRLPVATADAPEHICGEARRIGYTGKTTTDLALYRLKIRSTDQVQSVTLPGIYIIEGGQFFDYEQWQRQREKQS